MRKLILVAIAACWCGPSQGAIARQFDSIVVKLTFDSITHYFYYVDLEIQNRSSDTFYMPVCQGYEFKQGILHQFCSYISARDTSVIVARPSWERDCNVDTVLRLLPHSSAKVKWDIRNNSMAKRPLASLGVLLLKTKELEVAGASPDYCNLRFTYTYYSGLFHFPKNMKEATHTTHFMYRKGQY